MKSIIVYGSLLGKTARLANIVGSVLQKFGHEVIVKDVTQTNIFELGSYDLIVLGCSTWDDGQLQFDFRPFNDKLIKTNLSNKKMAIFAIGGHRYPHFCYAADILEKTAEAVKAQKVIGTLKLDLDHDEPEDKVDVEIIEWAQNLAKSVST